MSRMSHLSVTIAGITRDLPIVQLKPGVSVALFDILDDVKLTEIAGIALAERIPRNVEMIVSVEGKSMALAHVVARETELPIVTIRKGKPKPYARNPVILKSATTITTGTPQEFWTERHKLDTLRGKEVAIVDDVASTGRTLEMLVNTIIEEGAGHFAGAFCVFTEGEVSKHPGVVALGHLPIFHD